jgi:ubiquinone/menaquinone biosynthesis C-methylase UbiE
MNARLQVKKDYYFNKKYNDINRFISYACQLELTNELIGGPDAKILEIGVGSGIMSRYYKTGGLNIATCDIDKELNPDYVADVGNLPFDDSSFDIVLAFEVLEHLPFFDFEKILKELERVSKKHIVISLPYRSACFEIVLKFPFIRTLFNKKFIDFFIRVPLIFKLGSSNQHYWEIDAFRFSLRRTRKIFKKYFKIKKELRPVLDYHNYFFVLEKK